MAIDATGTPTSLGIPTLQTGVDNPSGDGINAMMEAIDALLVQAPLSSELAGITVGSIPVWDGSGWSTGSGGSTPAGALVPYAAASAPSGWLLCDGSAVSRSTYSSLFAVIATNYGVGDGSTTFNVPDLRGRMPVGLGTHTDVDALGESDGAAVGSRRPKHAHTVTDPGHLHTDPGGGFLLTTNAGNGGGNANVTTGGGAYNGGYTSSAGTGISVGSAGMTDTPAYLVVNYIIKT